VFEVLSGCERGISSLGKTSLLVAYGDVASLHNTFNINVHAASVDTFLEHRASVGVDGNLKMSVCTRSLMLWYDKGSPHCG